VVRSKNEILMNMSQYTRRGTTKLAPLQVNHGGNYPHVQIEMNMGRMVGQGVP